MGCGCNLHHLFRGGTRNDEAYFRLEAGAVRWGSRCPAGSALLLRFRADPAQAARYEAVLDGLEATFGPHAEAGLYSAPGRTEIGGNHTDHQHGRVLAGSVNIDMIAAAGPNTLGQLRVQSEGYDLCVIDLNDLAARKEEENTSAAILRGECEAFRQRGPSSPVWTSTSPPTCPRAAAFRPLPPLRC